MASGAILFSLLLPAVGSAGVGVKEDVYKTQGAVALRESERENGLFLLLLRAAKK